MEEKKDVIVLTEYRRISWVLRIYNREDYHGLNPSELRRHIVETSLFSLALATFALDLLSGILYCFDTKFDVAKSSMAATFVISIAQIFIIYRALVMNNRKITQMIDNIQMVINRREDFVFYFESLAIFLASIGHGNVNNKKLSNFRLHQGQNNYNEIERKHAFISKLFFNTIMWATAIFLTLSALWPVFFAIFGHPTPNHWALPLDLQ